MALKPFNTIAGFSVGNTGSITVIDSVGNVSANFLSVTANANLGNYATANFFTGDGGLLTNISATTSNVISNGTSNVNIPVASGNINLSVGGTSNVLVVTTTGANIAGTLNATSNVTGSNLITTSNLIVGNAVFSRYNGNLYSEAWIYSGVNYSITANETNVNGMFFSSDGSNMYVAGLSDRVYQYTLGTAWDVSTASLTQSIAVQSDPQAVEFKPDGTKMYLLRDIDDRVYEYSLSTPWNISTASNIGNVSITAQETTPFGLAFKSDGTAMYVVGQANDTVYQYALGTPWSVNTASFTSGNSFSVAAYDTTPEGIDFSSDGTQMFVAGFTTGEIYQFNLTSAWNVNSAQYVSGYNPLFASVPSPQYTSVFVSFANNRAYVADTGTDRIYQLDTSVNGVDLVNSKLLLSQDMLSNNVFVENTLSVSGNTRVRTLVSNGSTSLTTLDVNGAVTFSTTGSNINLGTSQTTGALTIGGTSQTGNIIVDRSTRTHTLAIANGATESANVKTINFGTNGAAGSNTVVNIGTSILGNGYITLGTLGATGNITLNQLTLIQDVTSATSTTTGALTVAGGVGVSGNVYAGDQIIATGNITGNYFIGNGSQLTGISATTASALANGTSNVTIPASGGNVNTSVGGISNVLVVTTTGANITGTLGTSGNTTVSNLIANTNIFTPSITTSATNGNLTIDPNGSGNLVISSTTPTVLANSGIANIAAGLQLTGTLLSGTSNYGLLHLGTTAPYQDSNVPLWVNYSANDYIHINYTNPNTGNNTAISTFWALDNATANYGYLEVNRTSTTLGSGKGLVLTTDTVGNIDLISVSNINFQTQSASPLTLYGNGTASFSGNIIAQSFANGNSNIRVIANSNVVISAIGNANIFTVTGTGVNVAGTLNATGNANVGNLGTAGLISASGNITGANIIANSTVFAANIQPVPVGGVTPSFNILGSLAPSTANASGYITNIYGGTSNNAGKGGILTLQGGFVGNSSSTAGGGDVYVKGQTGGLLGTGGNIYIIAGGEDPVFHDGAYAIFYGSSSGINGNAEIYGGSANGTNIVGGSTIIAGGKSTGNANAGVLLFQTSTAGASGTTPQTYANRVVINSTTVNITTSTNSTSTTSGGLVVVGGVGISGNLYAGGIANITGNLTASNIIGTLANGTSNVAIPTSSGNINLTVGGGTPEFVVTSTGANVVGTLAVTGNTTVGNLIGTVANGTSNIGIVNNGNISLVRSGTTRLLATNTGVTVTGAFSATSKSFLIEHPLKPEMYLQYGSLESPYHGVRLTGEGFVKNGKCTIQLPDYIKGLVKQEGSQVQLTNYKHGRTLYIESIDVSQNMFVVKSNWKLGELKFFWSFTAIRKDVEDLVVEYR